MADSGGAASRRLLSTRRKLADHVASSSAGVDIPGSASCIPEDSGDGDAPLATSPDGDADFPIFYGTPPSMNIAVFRGGTFVEASVFAGTPLDIHAHLDDMLAKHMIHHKFSHRDAIALVIPAESTGTCITRHGWTVKTAVLALAKE